MCGEQIFFLKKTLTKNLIINVFIWKKRDKINKAYKTLVMLKSNTSYEVT